MGRLIAIEGIDGSGKGTQTQALAKQLRDDGYSVAVYSFPRYAETAYGKLVGRYLNGELGDLQANSPWLVVLPFAMDRYESKDRILADLRKHDFVLCDRYVASNMAHQMAKLPDKDWSKFYQYVYDLEYGTLGVPRPDLVLELAVPVNVALTLIAKKKQRDYTDKKADLHEADLTYLENVSRAYQHVAVVHNNWAEIPCMAGTGALKTPEQITAVLRSRLNGFKLEDARLWLFKQHNQEFSSGYGPYARQADVLVKAAEFCRQGEVREAGYTYWMQSQCSGKSPELALITEEEILRWGAERS